MRAAAAAGNFHARACERQVAQACVDALALFSAPGSGSKSLRRVGLIYRKLCFEGDIQACELGAFIAADGYQGRFSASKDLVLARELATFGCKKADSETLCLLGEELYGDVHLNGADPFAQMEFARINCARNIETSCFSLAAFHQKREEWVDTINYYQKSCGLGMARACGLGNQVKQFYEAEILPAKQEQDQFQAMLDNREYADAVWAAIYHFKTADKLAYAIRTINAKGGMGSVPTNYLYITASWFSHGEIRNIADREMARRGTGLEGTFGTGTNNAGQASARWEAANGSSRSASRSSSGGGYTPVPGPTTAEIVENTRKKYHYVNCVMSKIPNNPNC